MLQALLANLNNANVNYISVTAATALAGYVFYSMILRSPLSKLPRTKFNATDNYIYDPSKRDEDNEVDYPVLEKQSSTGQWTLMVNDVHLAHEIFQRQDRYRPRHAFGRSQFIAYFHRLILGGANIGNARGADWQRRRDALVPPFQSRMVIPDLLPFLIRRTEELIEEIKQQKGKVVDMDALFIRLTVDVICEYLFGESPKPDEVKFDNMKKPFVTIAFAKLKIMLQFLGIKDARALEIERNEGFVRSVVERVKHEGLKRSNGSPTLVEQLLEREYYQGPEGEDRLIQDLLFMVFAGHDTTGHSLTVLTYTLSQVPEWQDKIRQEVDSIVPTSDDITAANLGKLKYTQAAIKESLRLHPVIPSMLLETYSDTFIRDFPVQKGTLIEVPVMRLQRNPNIFKKPNAYLPERWLQEEEFELQQDLEAIGNDKDQLGRAFMTFSQGTHSCLGMNLAYLELRVVIGLLVKSFDIKCNGPAPEINGMLLRLKDPLAVEFTSRKVD